MKFSISIFTIVIILNSISCSNIDRPYYEYESDLKEAICKCIGLDNFKFTEEQFLKEYEKCQKATSTILKYGLDKFPEDPRLSKNEYRSKMDSVVLELSDQCMKRFGKENPLKNTGK